MSHYAKVIEGVVVKVIVAEKDYIDELPDRKTWIQTSYNTRGNIHLENKAPLRGNFAGVGYIYDDQYDVFYPPKPKNAISLDKNTWTWILPETKTPE